MKKVTFTIIAALTYIMSMAQNSNNQHLFSVLKTQSQQKSLRMFAKAAQSKLPIISDVIIRDKPEGEAIENLQRKAFCTVPGGTTGIDYVPQTCAVGNFLKGKDGNLYIYDALGKCYTFSYLKLEPLGGSSYVLHTPQAIDTDYDSEGKTINLYATRLKLEKTPDGLNYIPEMTADGKFVGDVKFELQDNTLTQVSDGKDAETELPNTIIALTTAEGEWRGFCTTDIVIKPFKETATELPEGLKPSTYVLNFLNLKSEKENIIAQVAIDGNDFYLKNPFVFDDENAPDMWIKGTKENSKVVFKPQYIGLNKDENNYVFMKPTIYGYQTTDDGQKKMTVSNADNLTFDLDATTGKLTCNEKGLMLINEGLEELNVWAAYADPNLTIFVDKPFTPANPADIKLEEYSEEDGQPVVFSIKAQDVNGEFILPEHLYYNVYFDSDKAPYTFDTETYSQLDDNLTDIPVSYNDGDYFFLKGNLRMFYAYVKDFKRVGIQMIYKGGGETKRSEIVWCDNAAGITDCTADSKVKIEYYDLCGRRLLQPTKGICISRITYSNGEQKTIKRIMR